MEKELEKEIVNGDFKKKNTSCHWKKSEVVIPKVEHVCDSQ